MHLSLLLQILDYSQYNETSRAVSSTTIPVEVLGLTSEEEGT